MTRPLLVRLYKTGSSASRGWDQYWVAFLVDGEAQSQGIQRERWGRV